jgi:hypothetical protein
VVAANASALVAAEAFAGPVPLVVMSTASWLNEIEQPEGGVSVVA